MTVGVGLIGPKRSPNGYGLGLYVAREILNCPEAELRALLGTSSASVREAGELINTHNDLRINFKGRCHTRTQPLDFFAREDIDVVMICSPPESHYTYIRQALQRGLHVWVEKPLLVAERGASLAQRLATARELFDQARQRRLWLSTNCQRVAALPVLEKRFGWPPDPKRVRLEMHVGTGGGRLENPDGLFQLLVAHPLGMMVKWGAAWPQSLEIDDWHFHPTADRHHLTIRGSCRRREGRMRFDVRLYQWRQSTPASIRLAIDDRQPIRVSTEIDDRGRVSICYRPEKGAPPPFRGPDHLTLSVRHMIAAIARSAAGGRPLIDNTESHLIYATQERMAAALFAA